jgi:hypothetical protein
MLELLFEMLLAIGWMFPVWLGQNAIYFGSFGYVRCEDEIWAGLIGIGILLATGLAGLGIYFLQG